MESNFRNTKQGCLVGMIAMSEEETFQLYNDYTYRMSFSVRYNKIRYRARDKEIFMRQFCCSKEGNKKMNGKRCTQYTKSNVRTGCKAYIQFFVDKNGTWTVTKHNTEHNHPMCSPNKRHLLPSHRKVPENDIQYIKQLSESEVLVADTVRLLEKQAGGPLHLGYGLKDVYNKLKEISKKSLDAGDADALINIFNRRLENEIDPDGSLVSFFWRDMQMLDDYKVFGDLVVFDTTYRTNKYDMICAPFVEMNHHSKNVMFGCGILLNEKIDSFIWLFRTFLKSVSNKHPITIMTDQAFSMTAAIQEVFPETRHRLCCWLTDVEQTIVEIIVK